MFHDIQQTRAATVCTQAKMACDIEIEKKTFRGQWKWIERNKLSLRIQLHRSLRCCSCCVLETWSFSTNSNLFSISSRRSFTFHWKSFVRFAVFFFLHHLKLKFAMWCSAKSNNLTLKLWQKKIQQRESQLSIGELQFHTERAHRTCCWVVTIVKSLFKSFSPWRN